ncbi:hypothetical protein ACFLRB_03355 [Acidobacteriota bacterium]
MYYFGECGSKVNAQKIVLSENRRKFVLNNLNRSTILKVKVDDCLNITGKRCDWLLIVISEPAAHFVELKGNKVEHALLQLENTIKVISYPENGYIKRKFSKKIAYAILSHCPIDSTEIQNKKIYFRKRLNAVLEIKNKEIIKSF